RVKRVTWLEIFYDLLVAAAFLQLGHGLSAGLSLLQFVACALPLWLTWTGFTFLQNRFDVADLLHRFLVFLQMAAIGVMGASVAHDALDTFCLAASTALFLIAAIYLRAYWAVPEARDYCALWGSAFALGAAAWLSAGYAGSEESFYAAGGVSMATMIVPLTPRARALGERYRIDFVHIGKRYALLTLIVLGQVFTDTVPMLATSEMGAEDLFEIGVLFSLLCAIWWIYFDDVAGAPLRPGPLKSTVWLYAHLPLLLGAVVLDVGVLKAASTAYGAPLSPEIRWMLSGSVALIFACVAAIDAVTERADATISDRARINTRWMSALVVLLLAPATSTVDSWVFLSLLLALTLSQVVFDLMFAPYSETNRDVLDDPEPVDVAATTSSRPESQRIVRKGTPAGLRRDLFFFLVEGSWGRVFVLFGFAFLLTNLLFAGLYMLEPGSIAGAEVGSFGDAFSFSVQTMSTIGFGGMTPGTPYGDLLVALEAGVTMIGIAIITGFVVAKATRP
ncbi:MAG: low temperature requirement protein A, partial [Myxococcota bacterium]